MIFRFAECELDCAQRELRRNGATIPLEPQVFDVLAYLVAHRTRAVSKKELFEEVWRDRFVSDAALSSRLKSARKAIGDSGREQRLIRTLHGHGFRFVAEVEERIPAGDSPVAAPVVHAPGAFLGKQVIQYCEASDGVRIAYARFGAGPVLLKAANWLNHLEFDWQSPVWRHWFRELGRDHTVVRYDARGNGLSDWNIADFSFPALVSDLEAVVEAAGLDRFSLLGISQGGAVAIDYAVRHPEKVDRLILYGAFARGWARRNEDPAEIERKRALYRLVESGWGQDNPAFRQAFTSIYIPDGSREQMDWFNELQRMTTSPANAIRIINSLSKIDVLELLPRVKVPTLVAHCDHDAAVPFFMGRELATGIPHARFVALSGQNHLLLESEPAWTVFLDEVRAFLRSDSGIRASAS